LEQALWRAGIQTNLVEATNKESAIAEINERIDQGYHQFIAVGGDGTNNTVVNVLMDRYDPDSPFNYALLPWGTGNDWAAYHGLSRRVPTLIRSILEKRFDTVDIGAIDFEFEDKVTYFTNAVGMGFDAFVVEKMQNESKVGRLSYLAEVIRSMGKYESVDLNWMEEDSDKSAKVFSFHIGLGHSAGGGLKILPHVNDRMGKLAVTVIKEDSRFKYFRNLINVMKGTIKHLDFVDLAHSHEVKIPRQYKDHVLECDGEKCGIGPCTIRIHKHKLNLLMSRKA
jgi:diacylglycerol kinase family enzyme